MCGENSVYKLISGLAGGLIPACAGKTHYKRATDGSIRAHPRVCGENSKSSRRFVPWSGSSPRVRGKLVHGKGGKTRLGLIPACAGKTSNDNH